MILLLFFTRCWQNNVMEIIKVSPFGYCEGVVRALNMALDYALSHKREDIYLLGMLVHNEDALKRLIEAGVHILDEKKAPLEAQLERVPNGASVLFSAHGHPSFYEEIASRKHLKTIDTTCIYVNENLFKAKNAIEEGRSILYIGSAGHLEAVAFLQNVEVASFYDVKSNRFFQKGEPPFDVFTQTTLGEDEIETSLSYLKQHHLPYRLIQGRCKATKMRQENLKKAIATHHPDLIIVLGSKTSNNSLKLLDIASKSGKPCYLCLNKSEVMTLDLSNYNTTILCSGASTSRETLLEVESYLLSLKDSHRAI